MNDRDYERDYDREPPTERYVPPTPRQGAREVYPEREANYGNQRVGQPAYVQEQNRNAVRYARAARINQIVWFIGGLIIAIITIRLILFLLAANSTSGFFQFILSLSTPFVLPFSGLFEEPAYGRSVLETASVVAIIVYALVTYGVTRLVTVAYAPTSSD